MNWTKTIIILFLLCLSSSALILASNTKDFKYVVFFFVCLTMAAVAYAPKKWALTFPLLVTLLSILAVELFLPILQRPNAFIDPTSEYGSMAHTRVRSGFGYQPVPGSYGSKKILRNGETVYDVTYTIGSDGYRWEEDQTKYDSKLFGGSFVFGEGLNDNETLSHFLTTNHNFKTKNLGVYGYGLQQALYYLENAADQPKTEYNILLTAPWHALRSSCKPSYSLGTPKYSMNSDGTVYYDGVCKVEDHFITRILKKSELFQLLQIALGNKSNTIEKTDLDLYLAIITKIHNISLSRDTKLLVAFIGSTEEELMVSGFTNNKLMEELKSRTDILVDVTLAEKRELLDNRFVIHIDDQHPSAEANRVRAKIIMEAVNNHRLGHGVD